MSDTMTDAGTMEITRLEEMFALDLPCEDPSCGKKAEWLLTAIPCGHQVRFCTFHKMREVMRFKMDTPDTRCHLSKDVTVTDLKVSEL